MQKRMSHLDTLRLVAILFIILYHFIPHVYRGGFLGVNIFLVLAGYLNGLRLDQFLAEDQFQLWPKIKRLLSKLYKPLLLFIGLISSYLLLFNREFITNWFGQVLSNLTFVNNWYQIIQGASYFDEIFQPSLLTHLWYLSVYVQFVLAYWLIVKVLKPLLKTKTNFTLLFATLTLISAILMALYFEPGSDPTRVYYGSDTRFFTFGVGLLASQVSLDKIRKIDFFNRYSGLIQVLLFSAVILLLFEMTDVGRFTYYGGMLVFDLIFALLVLALVSKPSFFSTLLTFKPFAFLGQKSLGVFLWYYPIFILSQRLGFNLPSWMQSTTTMVVLIFLLGLMTDFLVTKPMITWPSLSFTKKQSLQEKAKSYLSSLSLKQKVVQVGQALLIVLTVTSFFFSQDSDEADRYKAQYNQTGGQPRMANVEAYTQEDINNYLNNLNQDQAFYTQAFTQEELTQTIQMDVTFIGDSIMLGAASGLKTLYPSAHMDAEVGRQLYNSAPLVQALNQEGLLGPQVVISLGSNGPFTSDQFDEFIEGFEDGTDLFFVTTHVSRPWRDSVNAMLHTKAQEYDHVHVIDWYAQYQGIENHILDTDDLHLNPEGRRYWINTLTRHLLNFNAE